MHSHREQGEETWDSQSSFQLVAPHPPTPAIILYVLLYCMDLSWYTQNTWVVCFLYRCYHQCFLHVLVHVSWGSHGRLALGLLYSKELIFSVSDTELGKKKQQLGNSQVLGISLSR